MKWNTHAWPQEEKIPAGHKVMYASQYEKKYKNCRKADAQWVEESIKIQR